MPSLVSTRLTRIVEPSTPTLVLYDFANLDKKRDTSWALALAHTPEMKRRTATEHIKS